MVVRRQKQLDYYYFYYISTKCTDRKNKALVHIGVSDKMLWNLVLTTYT